jgi:hypothetical protein
MKKFTLSFCFIIFLASTCLASTVNNFWTLDGTLWEPFLIPDFGIGFYDDLVWLCDSINCIELSNSTYSRSNFSADYCNDTNCASVSGKVLPFIGIGIWNFTTVDDRSGKFIIHKVKNSFHVTIDE